MEQEEAMSMFSVHNYFIYVLVFTNGVGEIFVLSITADIYKSKVQLFFLSN